MYSTLKNLIKFYKIIAQVRSVQLFSHDYLLTYAKALDFNHENCSEFQKIRNIYSYTVYL